MAEFRQTNVLGSYLSGRRARQDEQAYEQRNALGQMEIEKQQQFNALAQNPSATPDQYIRAGRSDVGNALINSAQSQRQVTAEESQRAVIAAQYALNSQTPKQVMEQQFPDVVQKVGQQWAQMDDTAVKRLAQSVLEKHGPQAGVGPAQPQDPGPLEQVVGPDGQPRFATRRQALGNQPFIKPDKPEKPSSNFRALTQAEVTEYGLPPGTSAQVDLNTGKIDVLSKRDATSGLSQKDQTVAKMKLNTVKLARQQLNNIRKRFQPLKGTVSAGAFGQGMVPSETGRAFDRSVDQMRSTLTALTRVPGVGAMSDYETKLDQAKFPTRQEYESVTEQQINDLDSMLNAIETGYGDLLGGQQSPSGSQSQGPVKVATPQDAMKLPSGTQFVTPDGRIKVRP